MYRAGYLYAVGVLLFFWFSWSLSVCKVPHIQAHIVPHTILSTTLESWVFEVLFQPKPISSTDVKALFLISLSSGFRVALRVSLLILNTSRQSSALPPFSALLVSFAPAMCDVGYSVFLMSVSAMDWSLRKKLSSNSSVLAESSKGFSILTKVLVQEKENVFSWYCLLWSHWGNHQSFRGKLQTIHFLFQVACGSSCRRWSQSLSTSQSYISGLAMFLWSTPVVLGDAVCEFVMQQEL